MKQHKKIFAIILSIVMVAVSTLPSFASAYDGGGHIDIYATEINGVKKDIEVRNEK